jgi:hypothetical protein
MQNGVQIEGRAARRQARATVPKFCGGMVEREHTHVAKEPGETQLCRMFYCTANQGDTGETWRLSGIFLFFTSTFAASSL